MGPPLPAEGPLLPLWLKLVYTAFVCVLVPVYWYAYGPTNFLYFCDVALIMGVAAVWLESSLLASAALVGIFLPQMLWVIDFLAALVGFEITGMTDYMFKDELTLFTRFLSFFHFWLPFFLLGVVWRLGYDPRGVWLWIGLAWLLMLVCYYYMPAPPAPQDNPNLPVNINYVHGFTNTGPLPGEQRLLTPNQYFALMMVGLPLLIVLPAHILFVYLFPPPRT